MKKNIAQLEDTAMELTAKDRFEQAVAGFDTRIPAIKHAVRRVREECDQKLVDKTDPEMVLHDVDTEDAHILIDEMISAYVENNLAEQQVKLSDQKVKNKSKELRLLIAEQLGLDPEDEWQVRSFHRQVVKKQEENADDTAYVELYEAAKAIVEGRIGGPDLATMLQHGVVPDELQLVVESNEGVLDFFKDLALFLEVAQESGQQMAEMIVTDLGYAINVVRNDDVFPKPLEYMAKLRLKAMRVRENH